MGDNSAIEWTEATWNPVTGCSKVSPGCAHCYAETVAGRFWPQQYVHTVERGFISVRDYHGERMDGRTREFTDVMCHEDRLDQPLRWKKPRRIFVNSMSDLFHEAVPDEFIDRVFAVMALAPQHVYQVLTKRAERMRDYSRRITDGWDLGLAGAFANHRPMPNQDWRWPLPNVWLGTSVENQRFADERIPLLLETPAAVRFISAEPLLSALCLDLYLPILSWVIVGGESGPRVRPTDPVWVRSVRDQCVAAGVPFFFKQWGGRTPKSGGRILDGREWSEFPQAEQGVARRV